jgi:ribosome biogenesis GTPase
MNLATLGWNPGLEAEFRAIKKEDCEPGRIVRQDRGQYHVHAEQGVVTAQLSGRCRHRANDSGDWPAVGDWVVLTGNEDTLRIVGVIPRSSAVVRKRSGTTTTAQVIAANVDWLLIVCGLDGDFNLRRIERYLSLAWSSDTSPAIILTKTDTCAEAAARIRDVERIAHGVPVYGLNSLEDNVQEELAVHLRPGVTLALVGSSGAGKSTLINALLGSEAQSTKAVRRGDDRGQHTTTHRELFSLEGGAMVIDTPGMRELQPWSDVGGLDTTFADIEALAAGCRFNDCSHTQEPGCAIQEALASGDLTQERWGSYTKQLREQRYLERRVDAQAQREEQARWKKIHKDMRKLNHRRSGR